MKRHYGITKLYMTALGLLGLVSMIGAQTMAPASLSVKAAALYSKNNMPALYVAAISGNVKAVQALIDQGVDINAQLPTSGATALHGAIVRNKPEVVKMLKESGARTDIVDHDGNTPLATAEKFERSDIAQLLK